MSPSVVREAGRIAHPQGRKALVRSPPRVTLTGEARKPNLKPEHHSSEDAFFFGDSGITLSNSFRLGDESNPV
jgi:hypothetical protein